MKVDFSQYAEELKYQDLLAEFNYDDMIFKEQLRMAIDDYLSSKTTKEEQGREKKKTEE